MPSNNPNAVKNLKHFSSTYQPANRGRKPNLLKKYINQGSEISSRDFTAVVNTMLGMSREKLQEKAKDNKEPVLVCLVAMALLGDMSNKSTKNLDNLMKNLGISAPPVRNVSPEPEVLEDKSGGDGEQFATYEYPQLPDPEGVVEDVDTDE